MNENELVAKLDRIEQQLTNLNRDVVMTLESGKSAHHRIDDLKRDICWTLGTSAGNAKTSETNAGAGATVNWIGRT